MLIKHNTSMEFMYLSNNKNKEFYVNLFEKLQLKKMQIKLF